MVALASEPLPVPPARRSSADLLAFVAVCLIWGTTWFAITLQLKPEAGTGVTAAPLVSVVYRFGLAAALLFGWCLITRRSLVLSSRQHLTTFGQGAFVFGINYAFVYMSEARIASAVTAVLFAGLAFVNLVLFRVVLRQRAPISSWAAACLGLAGVAVVSWAELQRAHMDSRAAAGLGFAAIAVLGAAIGNLFSFRSHEERTDLVASTAWAMMYGAALLAVVVIVTGQPWRFLLTPSYVGSLAYLSVFGSVAAFLLYFGLARSRGWTFASYISAVTPILAMGVSSLLEGERWGLSGLVGIALVVSGQLLLGRGRRL